MEKSYELDWLRMKNIDVNSNKICHVMDVYIYI